MIPTGPGLWVRREKGEAGALYVVDVIPWGHGPLRYFAMGCDETWTVEDDGLWVAPLDLSPYITSLNTSGGGAVPPRALG